MHRKKQLRRELTIYWDNYLERQSSHNVEYRKHPYLKANKQNWDLLLHMARLSIHEQREITFAICKHEKEEIQWINGYCIEIDEDKERFIVVSHPKFFFFSFAHVLSINFT